MKMNVLGSNSKGNCYILETDTDKLIIDAGISIKDVQIALDFDFKNVAGTLVTHEHGDHSKAIKDLIKIGVDIYTSKGTAEALKIQSHRVHYIKSLEQFEIGNFIVLPFKTEHDCTEPLRIFNTI